MVATSPAVASRPLALGKNSTFTRRLFCPPQLSVDPPPPRIEIREGSVTSSLTVFWSSPTTTRRKRLPMQSTCFNTPLATPEGLGPSHQGTAFPLAPGGAP